MRNEYGSMYLFKLNFNGYIPVWPAHYFRNNIAWREFGFDNKSQSLIVHTNLRVTEVESMFPEIDSIEYVEPIKTSRNVEPAPLSRRMMRNKTVPARFVPVTKEK